MTKIDELMALVYECVATDSPDVFDRMKQALEAALKPGEAVASIYITPDGQREVDDWRVELPAGRNVLYTAPPAQTEALKPGVCAHCNGSGRMVRDPDIGTDQECFVCEGSGVADAASTTQKDALKPGKEIDSVQWNQVQVCTWIGNQLMTQPSMFERNAVCKFVRSLGRNEKLAKYFPAPPAQPTCKPNLQVHTTGWVAPKDHYAVPVLFNPYTGEPRDVRDVQSDPQGILIVPPGKVAMLAAPPAQTPDLRRAAQAVIDRWDSPDWKDGTHTADYINALRAALAEPTVKPDLTDREPKQSEPVGWSITCNGHHTGNFYQSREVTELRLIEANRRYPNDALTIEPLFAAQTPLTVREPQPFMRRGEPTGEMRYNIDPQTGKATKIL